MSLLLSSIAMLTMTFQGRIETVQCNGALAITAVIRGSLGKTSIKKKVWSACSKMAGIERSACSTNY